MPSQIFNALPTINNLSTVAAVGCVFPTYFLHLRSRTYRWILSLGIASGLATLAVTIIATLLYIAPHHSDAPFFIFCFSPLNIVLIAILVCIQRITWVGLWSTVVLVCAVINWTGISLLVLALQP